MAEIHSYIGLSTGHVTKEVAEQLDLIVKLRAGDGHRDPEVWQYWIVAERWSTYGWWIWASPEDDIPEDMPACLTACFRYAHANNCRWILFDCDVDADENLLTYDW